METRYTLITNALLPGGKRADVLFCTRHGTTPSVMTAQGAPSREVQSTQRSEILAIGSRLSLDETVRASLTRMDGSLCLLTPAFCDLHTHCYEPGYPYRETLDSGMSAAVAGGYDRFVCMPNTRPCVDSPALVQFLREKSALRHDCSVLPCASLTRADALGDADGQTLCDLAALKAEGALAFSDHGAPPRDNAMLLRAMRALAELDALYLCSPADVTFADGAANEGRTAAHLGLTPVSTAREVFGVARILAAARQSGCRVHIQNITCADSVALLRAAKASGLRVSADTAPPYFLLTDLDLLYSRAAAKLSPPLRTNADREAVAQAVCDGTIDAIASDHTPCEAREKEDLATAAFGMTALESAFALSYTNLVRTGHMSLSDLLDRFTTAPCAILGVPPPRIEVGERATFNLLSTESVVLERTHFHGKSACSPFLGLSLHGLLVHAVRDGTVISPNANKKARQ